MSQVASGFCTEIIISVMHRHKWIHAQNYFLTCRFTLQPPIDERVQSSQQRANSIIVQSGTGKSHIFSFGMYNMQRIYVYTLLQSLIYPR